MTRRLKIAFVVDSARTARAGGLVAAERIIESLREVHDVISVGLGGDVALEQLHIPLADEVISSNSFVFAKPDTKVLGRALDGVDLVHVQLPFFLGYRAMSLARARGLPVVAAHHVQPENVLEGISLVFPQLASVLGRPGLARTLNRLVTQTFYNHADALICPSQFALEELRTAGLTTPSVVISNGAPRQFAPLASRPPHLFTVLSVGRLVPEKRHDLVVEAVLRSKHASSVRLVIVGKGPLQEKLEQQAKDLPVRAEFGFRSDEELLRLYQTADLYVHPSEVELEGMAVLEAMRCGCPSVTSDSRKSATRQFALGAGHLFPTGDAQALADCIDDWFEHPQRLESARARTLGAVKGYGLDHTVAAYARLYERVAELKARPSARSAPRAAGVLHRVRPGEP